jgi:alpha-L-rhamnosidase
MLRFSFLATLCLTVAAPVYAAGSRATADHLRCEYRVDPLGIDVAQPRLFWQMQDTRRGAMQTAYQVLVASTAEKLAADQGDLWDSGRVASRETTQIVYAGQPLGSRTECHWKVRIWDGRERASAWSKPAVWTMGLLEPGDVKAQWIGLMGEMMYPGREGEKNPPLACPLMRKEFQVAGPIRRATLYASALGVYRFHINGRPVGNDYFTPDWTDYRKRVYYNTYDVTELIEAGGANAIGGVLAAGWYAGSIGWESRHYQYGQHPRLFGQLEIELADGTTQTVVTDQSWKAAFGPFIQGEFLAGETFDARKEILGWDRPGLDDSAWTPVATGCDPGFSPTVGPARRPGLLAASGGAPLPQFQAFPGVTVQETGVIYPVKITEPKRGAFVFDMGQNFAGFARVAVRGLAGTKLRLRFAEVLNPNGTIYTKNLRGAQATDTYILKGAEEGDELWQPRFTYHGFRYVEMTGYPGKPHNDTITGVVIGSNCPPAGSFECSNAMLNRLYQNIVWTQRANFMSVPTDCPQRDERLGWMGDAEAFCRTATYNADVAAFFTKWLVDVDDAQKPDGEFSDVSPRIVDLGGGVAAWADAGVICPWTIYQIYGDRRLLEEHYPAMVRWVEYCRRNSQGLLRPAQGFGDWLSIEADTPKDVLATAYFAHSAQLTAEAASKLGKVDDARKYRQLFDEIKRAFNKAYVAPDGRIKGNTQTGYVLALAFGLLSDENRPAAVRRLVDDIQARRGHLSTGFVGTSQLMPVLSANHQAALADRLLLNETFPSWGYTIGNGATTIWERWDGWTSQKGFQDPGMNSFSHYAFGAVGQWLLSDVAGLGQPTTDGQGREGNGSDGNSVLIRPEPPAGVTWVKASYGSIQGQVSVEWRNENGKFSLDATIPANLRGTFILPGHPTEDVAMNGKHVPAEEPIEVAAGHYHIVMPSPR